MQGNRLTGRQRETLRLVSKGEWLSYAHLAPLHELQKKGLIEEVKTSFISQVSLRITTAGRRALQDKEGEGD